MVLNQLIEKIKNNDPLSISSPYRKAAVAIIIRLVNNTPNIIFVLRSSDLKEHPGQIAFPGGRIDKKDTNLIDTAIRETHEEIGITLTSTDCIGRIDDFITNTSYHVTPYIFKYTGHEEYKLSDEHEDIFEVSLEFLLDENNQSSKKGFYYDREWILYSYKINDNQIIWGATGCMLFDFLQVLRS